MQSGMSIDDCFESAEEEEKEPSCQQRSYYAAFRSSARSSHQPLNMRPSMSAPANASRLEYTGTSAGNHLDDAMSRDAFGRPNMPAAGKASRFDHTGVSAGTHLDDALLSDESL